MADETSQAPIEIKKPDLSTPVEQAEDGDSERRYPNEQQTEEEPSDKGDDEPASVQPYTTPIAPPSVTQTSPYPSTPLTTRELASYALLKAGTAIWTSMAIPYLLNSPESRVEDIPPPDAGDLVVDVLDRFCAAVWFCLFVDLDGGAMAANTPEPLVLREERCALCFWRVDAVKETELGQEMEKDRAKEQGPALQGLHAVTDRYGKAVISSDDKPSLTALQRSAAPCQLCLFRERVVDKLHELNSYLRPDDPLLTAVENPAQALLSGDGSEFEQLDLQQLYILTDGRVCLAKLAEAYVCLLGGPNPGTETAELWANGRPVADIDHENEAYGWVFRDRVNFLNIVKGMVEAARLFPEPLLELHGPQVGLIWDGPPWFLVSYLVDHLDLSFFEVREKINELIKVRCEILRILRAVVLHPDMKVSPYADDPDESEDSEGDVYFDMDSIKELQEQVLYTLKLHDESTRPDEWDSLTTSTSNSTSTSTASISSNE